MRSSNSGSSMRVLALGLAAALAPPACSTPTVATSPASVTIEVERRGATAFSTDTARRFLEEVGSYEPGWSGRHPTVLSPVWVHAASEVRPSFAAFDVVCDERVPCGYLLVSLDGGSATVAEYDTAAVRPLSGRDGIARTYRLGPLDWFALIEVPSGGFTVLHPGSDEPVEAEEFSRALAAHRSRLDEQRDLPLGADTAEDWAHALATTDAGAPRDVSVRLVPDRSLGGGLGTASAVPGALAGCGSPIPCYVQKQQTVSGKLCYPGCTPTAFSMLYGYWDGNGKANLVTGAATTQTAAVDTMIWDLNRYMGTVCDASGQGSTGVYWTVLWKANSYPVAKGYASSSINADLLSTDGMHYSNTVTEINAGRPVELNYVAPKYGHSVAVHGYSTVGNTKYFKVEHGLVEPHHAVLLRRPERLRHQQHRKDHGAVRPTD